MKWTVRVCRGCRAAVCDEACRYRHLADGWAFHQAVQAAKEKYTLVSPRDDRDLVTEAKGSHDHKVVTVMQLEDLRQDVRRYLLARGLSLAILEEPGEQIEEALPAGIFARASEESIEDVLWRYGLPNTFLHAELDYATGVLEGRVSEDILWDPTQKESVFSEPIPRHIKRVHGREVEFPGWPAYPSDRAERENRERETRFMALTAFLQEMFACAREGFGPALVETKLGWRFKHFNNHKALMDQSTWRPFQGSVEVERHTTGGVTVGFKPNPVPFIQALWAYVWWRRRVWLERQVRDGDVVVTNLRSVAYYGNLGTHVKIRQRAVACLLESKPVWLSEPHLAAVREAFRRLLEELKLPHDVIKLREERKVTSHLQRLQNRLAYLEDLEERSIERLQQLQAAKALTSEKIQAAIKHLDRIAEDKVKVQAELEYVVLKEAQEFYGPDFLGYDLLQAEHSPEELEELRAEVEVLA